MAVETYSVGVPGGNNTQIQYNNNGAFGGASGLTYDNSTNTLTVAGSLGFSSAPGVAADTFLVRPSANQLSMRNGATSQSLIVSNTFTSASIYEQLAIRWTANLAIIATEAAGTGVQQQLAIKAPKVQIWADYLYFLTPAGAFIAGFVPQQNGVLTLIDAAGTAFGRLQFGGTGTAHPAIKRSSASIHIRLADDTAFAPIVADTVQTGTNYTVATLPAAGSKGRRAHVTDALAPTYLGMAVGGGTVNCPVFDNGTNWVTA